MNRRASRTPAGTGEPCITTLRGVGPKVAQRLGKLGVATVADLLLHLPVRYQDRTRIQAIGGLRAGMNVVVEGRVELSEVSRGRRPALLCRISDGTGTLTLRFFHYSAAIRTRLDRGRQVRAFGEIRPGPTTLELVHPELQVDDGEELPALEQVLTPVYPTTEGLHQLSLRKLAGQALSRLDCATGMDSARDLLPDDVLSRFQLPAMADALRYIHAPPPDAPVGQLESRVHPFFRRLVFEELVAHHISLRRLRHAAREHRAPAVGGEGGLVDRLRGNLDFEPTAAQARVVGEILDDLRGNRPMLRLVQGDVGCGKTLVAVMAALHCLEAGHQVAIMAPTEMLAEQHARSFASWLRPLGLDTVLLTGRARGSNREQSLQSIRTGGSLLVVGTHALFQDEVEFNGLALVIIDEQHRFGVHQRLALQEKGATGDIRPHQLVMTATPIPRTLAMTAYADLDVSVIDELPPGRSPVQTVVVPESKRDQVIERVRQACAEGRQVYWVCPLIDESEALQCQAAQELAAVLEAQLPEFVIGLVHGRQAAAGRDRAMAAFKAGEVDLLVATTVIEVGVDVPNASLMIIENAERMGLAQLHQLRGRVGRGKAASHCVLLYRSPLSQVAQERLSTLRETADGFEVARRDLEIRGPGEVLGTRQSGLQQMRVADLARDQGMIEDVRRVADDMLANHPGAIEPLLRRWLPKGRDYGRV